MNGICEVEQGRAAEEQTNDIEVDVEGHDQGAACGGRVEDRVAGGCSRRSGVGVLGENSKTSFYNNWVHIPAGLSVYANWVHTIVGLNWVHTLWVHPSMLVGCNFYSTTSIGRISLCVRSCVSIGSMWYLTILVECVLLRVHPFAVIAARQLVLRGRDW